VKVSSRAAGHLVVTNVSALIRVLLALALLGIIAAWIAPDTRAQAFGWTAVCVVFGLALMAANERSTFDFDRQSFALRWRRDTPFRHASGEIPLDAITALSIERDFKYATPSRGRGGARRLVLLTTSGPIPFTTSFTGIGSDVEDVGREVRQFLMDAHPGHEIPLNAPR